MGTHRSGRRAEGAFRLTEPTIETPAPVPQTEAGASFPTRRLYGRSKGKALRIGQARLVDELLPRLLLDLSSPCPPLPTLFPAPIDDLWLEIGFGGGEHLLASAANHRRVGFIGCEPFVNGMAKLLAGHQAAALANVRLHHGDAIEAIDWLPDASLGRVFLFYPDPWPKRRHNKRRFVSPQVLAKLARVMKRGAQLRFATDIDDYAGWTLARVIASDHFVWTASGAQDWLEPWDGWTRTKYEAKAMAAGRKPVYLTFVRR